MKIALNVLLNAIKLDALCTRTSCAYPGVTFRSQFSNGVVTHADSAGSATVFYDKAFK